MKQSFSNHQKQIDRDAEIDSLAEHVEQEMREELLDGGYYTLEYRDDGRIKKDTFDRDDVVTEMAFLDGDTFNLAVMMMAKDPIEAAKILNDLMIRAVEQILGVAKISEDAAYRMEIRDREQAA